MTLFKYIFILLIWFFSIFLFELQIFPRVNCRFAHTARNFSGCQDVTVLPVCRITPKTANLLFKFIFSFTFIHLYKCATCHVNKIISNVGRSYFTSRTVLSHRSVRWNYDSIVNFCVPLVNLPAYTSYFVNTLPLMLQMNVKIT